MIKLGKILKVRKGMFGDTMNIESMEEWSGGALAKNDALVVVGVKIADRTYDAYTNIDSFISQALAIHEKHKSDHRTESDKRTFDHLRAITETGGFVSCLYGCPASRKPRLYGRTSVWGQRETLQDLLLPNLMKRTPRFPYSEGTIFRVYVEIDQTTKRAKSCWFSATGQDEWLDVPNYTKEVKLSELPSAIDDMTKNYYVLHDFAVGNFEVFENRRSLGNYPHRPRSRSLTPQ